MSAIINAPPKDMDASSYEIESGTKKSDNLPSAPTSAPGPRDNISKWQWIFVCVGLYLGAILYGTSTITVKSSTKKCPLTLTTGLDTTIAAAVQGEIYERLGHLENLPWVGLGFPMASVAIILVLCQAYALFDVKPLFLSSIIIFEVGSAICCAAPTSNVMIVGRVIAGAGGSGMYLG